MAFALDDADAPVTINRHAQDGPSAGELAARMDRFDCDATPTAWVLGGARACEVLEAAGFRVEPLPLDTSPGALRGLIFLGSHASEHGEYEGYVREHSRALYEFVDRANVLVQMAQDPALEERPPFLPTTHEARRDDRERQSAHVLARGHPLLSGVRLRGRRLAFSGPDVGPFPFDDQGGFEVVLSGDEAGASPLLMEGAYGQGRIVLSGMRFDAPVSPSDESEAFSDTFLANLRDHVMRVCARATTALDITPRSADEAFTQGSSMLAVLPDTQVYSLRRPGLFYAQTGWIAGHAERLDIRFVAHLGDVVNNNSRHEWRHAGAAMGLLDGVVPFSIAPGNHDYGPSGDASTRETLLNEYVDFETSAARESFGGEYEPGRLDNTYHLFSIGGRDWILLSLEWGPRDEVIEWANGVMEQHPDRHGILVTHAYTNNNDRRYDHTDTEHPQDFNPHQYATTGGVNDGEELWQKLVRHHRFSIVLSGHVLGDGTGYVTSETDLGNTCHQMLSNYQMRREGGQGYMRLLEFLPDGQTVQVFSYSPYFDNFLLAPDQRFSFRLD
ncbi:MAG: hypothetical protein PVI30_21785 [Myxococcales bacterium]|jgi:hypothetical protein